MFQEMKWFIAPVRKMFSMHYFTRNWLWIISPLFNIYFILQKSDCGLYGKLNPKVAVFAE